MRGNQCFKLGRYLVNPVRNVLYRQTCLLRLFAAAGKPCCSYRITYRADPGSQTPETAKLLLFMLALHMVGGPCGLRK